MDETVDWLEGWQNVPSSCRTDRDRVSYASLSRKEWVAQMQEYMDLVLFFLQKKRWPYEVPQAEGSWSRVKARKKL